MILEKQFPSLILVISIRLLHVEQESINQEEVPGLEVMGYKSVLPRHLPFEDVVKTKGHP